MLNRRLFLKRTALAAGAFSTSALLPTPHLVAAEGASDRLNCVQIGCGGRGSGAASQAINADPNVVLTAMGDAFEDQLQKSLQSLKTEHGEKVKVESDKCFVGLDAYQKVINSGVDVVLLATPPGFRPAHLKAAIDAGKHVFCEKPMATDAPGVRSVLESVKSAKEKNLSLVAGFCWRRDTARHWYNFVWLSGDGYVEQCCHSVDKVAWGMKDQAPLKAVAVGGRQTPNNQGNIFDHMFVVYEFPKDVRGFVGQRQVADTYSENSDYLMGSEGFGKIPGWQAPIIKGKSNWRYHETGPKTDMYQIEHNELFASIRSGKPINDGEWMAQSTLMGLMGRMAAYTGQEVTWEQAMNSQEKLVPDNPDWNMKLEIAPMAMPGATKLS